MAAICFFPLPLTLSGDIATDGARAAKGPSRRLWNSLTFHRSSTCLTPWPPCACHRRVTPWPVPLSPSVLTLTLFFFFFPLDAYSPLHEIVRSPSQAGGASCRKYDESDRNRGFMPRTTNACVKTRVLKHIVRTVRISLRWHITSPTISFRQQ